MATQDIMTKTKGSGFSPKSTQSERRGTRRCKINQLMRIRPSDPEKEHFEDLRGSTSVSRSGVAFQTSETGYELGMRLFVTMPYSRDPAAVNREYLEQIAPEIFKKQKRAPGFLLAPSPAFGGWKEKVLRKLRTFPRYDAAVCPLGDSADVSVTKMKTLAAAVLAIC